MSAKILVVDDSGLARRTLRRLLEEMGHTVEEAADGAQAIERYFLGHHDLVVLDMVMEGMYGLEVLMKLKQLDSNVRIIVVTADIQNATRAETRAAGAVALINKPIAPEELTRVVNSVLKGETAWS
jgi:two-component system, chemotaxis family, chemotaxis protein CheY